MLSPPTAVKTRPDWTFIPVRLPTHVHLHLCHTFESVFVRLPIHVYSSVRLRMLVFMLVFLGFGLIGDLRSSPISELYDTSHLSKIVNLFFHDELSIALEFREFSWHISQHFAVTLNFFQQCSGRTHYWALSQHQPEDRSLASVQRSVTYHISHFTEGFLLLVCLLGGLFSLGCSIWLHSVIIKCLEAAYSSQQHLFWTTTFLKQQLKLADIRKPVLFHKHSI